jgi:hypothetical protein
MEKADEGKVKIELNEVQLDCVLIPSPTNATSDRASNERSTGIDESGVSEVAPDVSGRMESGGDISGEGWRSVKGRRGQREMSIEES